MRKKPIAVKIENVIGALGDKGGHATGPLVNFQRRGGQAALNDVALHGARGGVAMLLVKNGASIDLDCAGLSPQMIATDDKMKMLLSAVQARQQRPVDAVIRKQAPKLEKRAQADTTRKSFCDFCKQEGESFPCM